MEAAAGGAIVIALVSWMAALLAIAAMANTLVNRWTWLRPTPSALPPPVRVSVLIPARNEAANIARAIEGARAAGAGEIRVYDDRSSDGTLVVLGDRAGPDLTVLHGAPLPPGWVGKPHACQRLGESATGDILLFVDADVELTAGAAGGIVSTMDQWGADVFTAVPRQRADTWAERLLMPLLHLTYVAWLPLALVPRVSDPRVLAANGQVLALRREAWNRIGGFASVRGAVVDDMAICGRAKAVGLRVLFADGHRLGACRMYGSFGEVWAGFSKNIYRGLGSTPALIGATCLYATAFVVPFALLPLAALEMPGLWGPVLLGVGANVAARGVLALRHGHRWWSVLLQPVAVLVLVAIALNSWRWERQGGVRWAGRVYG